MLLLGISTKAHIIDVCLPFRPAGNQFLNRGSISQDIYLAHANCTPLLEEKELKKDRLKNYVFFGHLQHT